ncbi:response regulator [Thermosyntropha sp.]|uniref:response regulator n=1 Tax=Thermosyntropha sp. TaxID=2740820 RepID=UPI0025CF08C9|nr:response regulator [Thermosyntropha sp.]MBO8158197.1 response regulator [Thermosyntropha sp.]
MKKVLIINDSRLERYILKDQLTKLDYEAEAVDEYFAFEYLKNYAPDAVIVNFTMQNITGDKLVFAIKKEFPRIKCYLCSCTPLHLEDYEDKGVDGVFKTPITLEQLRKVLDGKMEIKVESFRFCPYCGRDLTKGGKNYFFCPFCGAKLKAE